MLAKACQRRPLKRAAIHANGFTLIELVIGIVVFSVAMVMIVSVVMPQAKKGIDPIWQVRAITLAQSVLNEVSAKAFDELTITSAGREPCNPCSTSSNIGADGAEIRNNYDDIDDYHGLILNGVEISDSIGQSFSNTTSDLFLGFSTTIKVFYDDNFDGINDDDTNSDGVLDTGTLVGSQKRIEVIVYTPAGEAIPFSTYRSNF